MQGPFLFSGACIDVWVKDGFLSRCLLSFDRYTLRGWRRITMHVPLLFKWGPIIAHCWLFGSAFQALFFICLRTNTVVGKGVLKAQDVMRHPTRDLTCCLSLCRNPLLRNSRCWLFRAPAFPYEVSYFGSARQTCL